MKVLCIYHANCCDGFGAATVVRKALGPGNVDFFPGWYGEAPPDVDGRVVVMVDFSYKRDVLVDMASRAKRIIILDHHASAQDDLVDLPANVEAYFNMSKSGAVIAWEYFMDGPPPKLLCHIQDRDLWKFELEGTRAILSYIFSFPYEFPVWDQLMETDTALMLSEGAAIERKHTKDVREFIEAAGYTTTIAGWEGIPIANVPYMWGSDAYHIMGEGHPFAACYYDTGTHRKFSLRSDADGIDVREIAVLFGGGGHVHAAGFVLPLDELDKLATVRGVVREGGGRE